MAAAVEHATVWPDPDSLFDPWEPSAEEIDVPEVFQEILSNNQITERLVFQDPVGRFVHKTLLEERTASPEPLRIGIIGLDHNYTSSPGDAKDVESLRGLGYSVLFRKVEGLTFEACKRIRGCDTEDPYFFTGRDDNGSATSAVTDFEEIYSREIRMDSHYALSSDLADSELEEKLDIKMRREDWRRIEIDPGGYFTYSIENVIDNFKAAIQELVNEGVQLIIGDCGFFFHFQSLASKLHDGTVFLSPVISLPLLLKSCIDDASADKILIFTACRESLLASLEQSFMFQPLLENLIVLEVHPEFKRAVNQGQVIDIDEAWNGKGNGSGSLRQMVEQTIKDEQIRGSRVAGIISECSCLAPFRELLEEVTSLPVFDWRYAITLYGQL